jgi:hypothetical protein
VVNGSPRGAKEQRSFKPQAEGSIPSGRIFEGVQLRGIWGLAEAGVAFAAAGTWPAFWAVLVVLLLVEIGFVLAGRNPWLMQARLDRRRERRTSTR